MDDKDKTDKFKNLKLINHLTRNTYDNTLVWENTSKDKTSSSYLSQFFVTKHKKIVFTLKCDSESEIKEDNILRVLFKNQKGEDYHTQVIKAITLKEYPALISIIKRLTQKHLGIIFESPFIVNKNKIAIENIKPKDSKAVVANNVGEYREYIIDSIKKIIRDLPKSHYWENKFSDIYDLYEKCKVSEDIDELNEYFYKITELAKRDPIGTPRWAN